MTWYRFGICECQRARQRALCRQEAKCIYLGGLESPYPLVEQLAGLRRQEQVIFCSEHRYSGNVDAEVMLVEIRKPLTGLG